MDPTHQPSANERGGTGRARHVLVGALLAGAIGSAAALVTVGTGSESSTQAFGAPAAAAPHDHSDHDHASVLGDDGRFTGPGEIWPPQPRNAVDVVALDLSDASVDRSDTSNQPTNQPMAKIALAIPSVREAVGEDYNFISATDDEIVPGTEKGRPDNEASLAVFYNLDRNQTVNVYIIGTELIKLVIDEADAQQPPLSDPEKKRAGELARAHWEEQGDGRIDQLEDFAILGVEPDGSYYDSRVAYVSFHLDDMARPELLAWVDLTEEIVLDARVDR